MLAIILSVIAAVVGLLGLTGSVVNGKRKDGYNSILQAGNAELRLQIADKVKSIAELEAKLKLKTAEAEASEKLRLAAVDIAQSRPAFETLGAQMVKQHKELLGAIGKQTQALANLAQVISKGQNNG